MNITKLAILSILLFTQVAFADNKDVFGKILKHNKEIKLAYNKLREAKSASLKEVSNYLPQANFIYHNYQNFHQIRNNTLKIKEEIITVDQRIFDFSLLPKMKTLYIGGKNNDLIFREVIAKKFLAIISANMQISLLEKELFLYKNRLEFFKKLQQIAKIKYKAGVESKTSYLRAEREFSLAQSSLLEITKKIKITKLNYFYQTGEKYQKLNFYKENKKKIPDIEIIKEKSKKNISLNIAKLTKKIYKTLLNSSRAAYLPKADIYYNRTKQEGNFNFFSNDISNSYYEQYGIRVSVPLWSSFKNFSDHRVAKKRYLAKVNELSIARQNIAIKQIEIAENYNFYQASLKTSLTNFKYNKNLLAITKNNYKLKRSDFLDLLDAQNSYFSSALKLSKTKYAQILNYFDYLYLVGELQPEYFSLNLQNFFKKVS